MIAFWLRWRWMRAALSPFVLALALASFRRPSTLDPSARLSTHLLPPKHAPPPKPNQRYKAPESGAADLGTETDSATDQQLCYHVLGTPQSEDAVVWAMPGNPTWMSSAEVTDDGE